MTELTVHVDLRLAAARSALNSLGGSLTLISLLAPLVLIGHAASVADPSARPPFTLDSG